MNKKVIDNREQVAIKYISDTLSKELIANNCTLHSILKIVAELGKAFNQISAIDADFDYFDHGLKIFAFCCCETPMNIEGILASVISNLLFGDDIENAIQNVVTGTPCWSSNLIPDYKFDEEKYKKMLKEIDALKGLIEIKMNWIPVSERLPETSGNYLVTTVHGYIKLLEFSTKHSVFNASDLQECPKYAIAVKAWMPLLEPYKVN